MKAPNKKPCMKCKKIELIVWKFLKETINLDEELTKKLELLNELTETSETNNQRLILIGKRIDATHDYTSKMSKLRKKLMDETMKVSK